ncbi:MAG TPA: prepilin-type N-terminal cleavage/methylation domain-containing protein [Candidatus Paceibacterota bacterium]|nr:prepilin-type N-terminal cleavage/methylation domain-containing protein [Candidatus Paceibacterota bacterium]
MKSILKKININNHGFTLLEMLFAVIIFSFALVSLMTIAGKGVIATASARDQLVAQFLAEESLEVVRNIRDSNYINGSNSWIDGLTECVDSATCDIEYVANAKPIMVVCPANDCSGRLLFNNNGQFRPEPVGTATTFWREIKITSITPDSELVLESTVHWRQKTINRSMTVTTRIADWQ